MNIRCYTRTYENFKHGKVSESVSNVFVLLWDAKRKEHSFIQLDAYVKHSHIYTGTPLVFDTPEQEREFLDYHPDAACMRKYYRYGHYYVCTPQALDTTDLKFEMRHGRWCWKKTA